MNWLSRFFHRRKQDAQLDSELRFHVEQQTADNIAAGMNPEEARRHALARFGGLEYIKEETRDARGTQFIESLLQDGRFALRMLRKSPGFTIVAVLTLALGIGANTAIFSLLDGLVLRNLPVPHPEQLVHVGAYSPDDDAYPVLSLPMFQEIVRDQNVFSSMFFWSGEGIFNADTDGSLIRADVWFVGGSFYSELGAMPEIGRLIRPDDVHLNSASPALVAVIGYHFWLENFGGDRDVIGKTIAIEQVPFTIIGVSQPEFRGMTADIPFEIAIPITAEPLIIGDHDVLKHLQRRDALWLDAVGRLKPGVTVDGARAQLQSLWPAIRAATMPLNPTPEERARFSSFRLRVASDSTGSSYERTRFEPSLYALLGISGLVLLIACMNLASLLLARAASRTHEMGVRIALGAGRLRLVRQMLTESLILSITGATAGFVFGLWGSGALSRFMFAELYAIPGSLYLKPDLRILMFATAVAIFTGVAFGLAPALRASAEDPNGALQQSSRNATRGVGPLGKGLILTQIALSVALLAGAGLLIRTLEKLREVQPGFQPQRLLDADLFPMPGGYKDASLPNPANYYRQLTEKMASLPGVESVGISHARPGAMEWVEQVARESSPESAIRVDFAMSMPGFFRTMGISLLRGRTFDWRDDDHAPRVAVVSESFAQALFPGGDAIGRRIDVTTESKWKYMQIIGVVSDATLYDIRKQAPPTIYLPALQYYSGWSDLLVRTRVAPAAIDKLIRQTVQSLGHEYVTKITTVTTDIDHSILQERITAMLSTFFAALALLIAGVGLFGLIAYTTTRRTRELGIRVALGAQRAGILSMILRETLTLTLVGVLIGVPCAFAATRLLAHMLFGVTPYDPLTIVLVSGTLLAVGALAGYIPARRAMRVDPTVALRHE